MADYAKMYLHLFKAVTKAIEILQKAQHETEELYISESCRHIRLFNNSKPEQEKNRGAPEKSGTPR